MLVSIWKEYPVVPILELFVLLIWAFSKLFALLYRPVRYGFGDKLRPI